MRNSENLYDYSQNLNPGGYSGFQQVTGMIEEFFGWENLASIFLGFPLWRFLRLRNSAWYFWGFVGGPRDLAGGFDFWPHSVIPVT